VINNEIEVAEAISSLAVDCIYSYSEQEGIVWGENNPITQPTEAEIQAEVERLQAEYDAQEYARNRKAKYDALNQFELISDDSINGTTTHKDAILAIKAKYPKPE